MSFKIKQLKYLSPASLNLTLIIALQVCVFLIGWNNNWWTEKNAISQTQISTLFAKNNEEYKALELLPSSSEKNIKLQKFSYQLIVGPLSQFNEINSTQAWKDLSTYWEENNLDEVVEGNIDEKLQALKSLVSSFNVFVTEKNYPTLMRVSNRMKIRELNSDTKSLEGNLFAYIKDIEFMQATIRTANLDDAKKLELNNALNEIQTAITGLQKDASAGIQGQAVIKTLLGKTKNAINSIRPLVIQNTLKNNVVFNGIFYAMIAIFIFSVVLGTWMLLCERHAKSKMKTQWENDFLILINEAFVKGNNFNSTAFSLNFNSTFNQIYNFILKKMQYGQMFQDTIPFPTILIDSNLQVRWFNQSLIAEWQLENFIKDRESLSWEHFSQLTNMSANDPVIDVIKNQHAGIFKLQVKPIESEKAVPYQMYVTPYQVGEEKLCLLFFYPLLSLEETIEMQTQSVVVPVRNTLTAMIDNKYDLQFSFDSKSDYEIGAIDELHQLFEELYQKKSSESEELLNQLTDKDIKLQDQQQLVQNLDNDIEQLKRLQEEMKQAIHDLKQDIIIAFDNMDSVKLSSSELFYNLKIHWEKFMSLQQNAEKLFAVLSCSKEQVQQMSHLRMSTKEVRDAIQSNRSNALKVIKALSAFVDKQNQNRNPLHNTWNSTMTELAKLPDFLMSLDRYIQHNEMILGKAVMKLEDSYKHIDENISFQSGTNLTFSVSNVSSKFEEIEEIKENLISNLKDVYCLMQQQLKVTAQSHEHLYYNHIGDNMENSSTHNS